MLLNFVLGIFRVFGRVLGAICSIRFSKLGKGELIYAVICATYFSWAAHDLRRRWLEDIFYSTACPVSLRYSKWKACAGSVGTQYSQSRRDAYNLLGGSALSKCFICNHSLSSEILYVVAFLPSIHHYLFSMAFLYIMWRCNDRRIISPVSSLLLLLMFGCVRVGVSYFAISFLTDMASMGIQVEVVELVCLCISCTLSILLRRIEQPSETKLIARLGKEIERIEGVVRDG